MFTKIKSLMSKRSTQIAVGIASVGGAVVGMASMASATTYDPTSALTGFASTITSTAAPIVVAVAGALVALAIVFWAVRFAFGFLGARVKR